MKLSGKAIFIRKTTGEGIAVIGFHEGKPLILILNVIAMYEIKLVTIGQIPPHRVIGGQVPGYAVPSHVRNLELIGNRELPDSPGKQGEALLVSFLRLLEEGLQAEANAKIGLTVLDPLNDGLVQGRATQGGHALVEGSLSREDQGLYLIEPSGIRKNTGFGP